MTAATHFALRNGHVPPHAARTQPADDAPPGIEDWLPAPAASLAEHLSQQLRLRRHAPRTLALAGWIVWNLDRAGYLRDNLGELARLAGAGVDELERALAVVQSLDPPGVGARTLRECLLLQLRSRPDADAVAIQLVEQHLKAVAERRYGHLARALSRPYACVTQAAATIRRLEPRPGRPFWNGPNPPVRADAVIEKCGDAYRIVLDDDGGLGGWPASAAGGSSRRRGWRATAAARRRQTALGVVRSIIDRQPDFLELGPVHVRPLSLRQVAVDAGVHESTVSRAVAHRYVDTPHGTFPLRFFFANRLPGDAAGILSPTCARARIREVVGAEDPVRPLTDGAIARLLAGAGVPVSRRTVAKYRGVLGIPSSRVRRSMQEAERHAP